jgi:hypothetical protein
MVADGRVDSVLLDMLAGQVNPMHARCYVGLVGYEESKDAL